MGDEPIPYYPTMPCHMAPCPPGETPVRGCRCRICVWARTRQAEDALFTTEGPIRPGTPAWQALLMASK